MTALDSIKEHISRWNDKGETAEVTRGEIRNALANKTDFTTYEKAAEIARLANALFFYDRKTDRAFFTPGR